MVSRIFQKYQILAVAVAVFCCLVMGWFALAQDLFAADSADTIARRMTARPGKAAIAGVPDSSGIAGRNLYSLPPEGKEEAAVADPLAELPETSLDLVLMGIVEGGGGGDSRAVILSKKEKTQQLYRVGDLVAGAQIQSIIWGKVILRVGARDEVLDMGETAGYRPQEASAPISAPENASVIPQKTVASAEGEMDNPLIPERVRLVLPEQGQGRGLNEE